ncbi:hypothetical protein G7B40_017300 [Aetokthonos hydrillicola Thurmond2011]|uniref:Uncharacterized protein n=2 Tax=Aetokthonos TaxID=1550243 RepID=A0AAP5I782_9CYAN|nr:hypothetical protein [Aetokthonos hydrillicola]MBO3461161.1 hypothetical protein [Aetokthonos hydrillicola CCALA 1050]MBW4588628.1 hypothetical protein [Aetokthonos hydrillicola CCALA 1050]MDR9896303.1 hypothetical protein [Aetokthonos hydrillicola Thurmond2011]
MKNKLHRAQLELLIIILFLIAGSGLRLLWATDMEWKSEEKWMFEQARQIASGAIPLPVIGMLSGAGVPNPGMTVWWFAIIGIFAHNPISMVRWVQCLNIATLWLFFGFAMWQIPPHYRKPWLWGLAIASVNPLAVVLSRKIWIPDLLAPFCFLVFLGHWFRQKLWGSFLWGIAGAFIGQVHMGGFFLASGLLLWTIWHDYKQKTLKKAAWVGWIIGTALGSIPLLPWFWAILPHMGHYKHSILAFLVPKFYVQWMTTSVGVNLSNPLLKVFWTHFLKEPLIFGIPTYLMIPAHIFLFATGLYPIYRFFKSRKKAHTQVRSTTEEDPALNFYLKALAFGVGGVFTLSGVNVQPYYIIVVFPFLYIWLALIYQNHVKLLATIALLQLFITFTFLVFIHRTGGFPGRGYGIVYRLQVQQVQSR